MEGKSSFYKIAFFVLFTAVLLTVVGIIAYFAGKGNLNLGFLPKVSSPTPFQETEVIKVKTPTPNPIETPISSDKDFIREAVYTKTGLNDELAEITISKNTGLFATGGVKEYEAVGGAYFLAAKVNGKWICVYDGQATPKCSEISQYNFPKDMVPECLDSAGKIITR